MSAFSRSSLLVAVIQTTVVATHVHAQTRTTNTGSAATPVLPEALISAADAFRSKGSGQRLDEGWRLLSLIRMNPFGQDSKGATNFFVGPLVSELSETNLTTVLGTPDCVYTNEIMGTNTACYVYTCGWNSQGICIEFSVDLMEAPVVWLHQSSLISAAECVLYRKEVIPRLKPHYDKIVAALRAGDLEADPKGRLQLPADYPVVSLEREVYVSREAAGLMVAFKLWTGRKSNMEGYLYSDARLPDAVIGQHPKLRIGTLVVAVEQRIDPHWYLIAYRID
ncbi:MAG: hypothetical protein HS113_29840 [Verrucomicrobiales bacterium]|nr:hypothetical protein [Verrucomicrobiales bacterium]